MRPKSKADLVCQPIGDEILVYDDLSKQAHHLNVQLAEVFALCDGSRDVEQIIESAFPGMEGDDKSQVVLSCLEEFQAHGLLEEGVEANFSVLKNRRQFLAAASVGLVFPAIASALAPAPANAASCGRCIDAGKKCCDPCTRLGDCIPDNFCGVSYKRDDSLGATCATDFQVLFGRMSCYRDVTGTRTQRVCADARTATENDETYDCCICTPAHAECVS